MDIAHRPPPHTPSSCPLPLAVAVILGSLSFFFFFSVSFPALEIVSAFGDETHVHIFVAAAGWEAAPLGT